MPSQHCQFQTFITIFLILYLSSIRFDHKLSGLFSNLIKLLLIISCSIIVFSRVYLVYHYWYQCLSGVAIGALWAFIWFKIDQLIMEKYLYKKIMRWSVT